MYCAVAACSMPSIAGRIRSRDAGSLRRGVKAADEAHVFLSLYLPEVFAKKCAYPFHGIVCCLAVIAHDEMPAP